jgi:hypothetical protein
LIGTHFINTVDSYHKGMCKIITKMQSISHKICEKRPINSYFSHQDKKEEIMNMKECTNSQSCQDSNIHTKPDLTTTDEGYALSLPVRQLVSVILNHV